MRYGRTKTHPVELVWTRAQTDFYVSQAVAISYLGKGHSQELIPTREVIDLVVSVIASDAAAKLLGVNPLGELRKDQFSSGHDAIVASRLLQKTKKILIRSHRDSCACNYNSAIYNRQTSPRPDDSDLLDRAWKVKKI
jgi:hypothetical protein